MGETERQPEMEGDPIEPCVDEALESIPEDGPAVFDTAEPVAYANNRILALLFDSRGPAWRYILRAGLISLIPSLLVSFLLALAVADSEGAMPQFDEQAGAVVLFVSVVIVSPAIETLLLGFGLWVFSFVTKKLLRLALASCILWAILHSLEAPMWGLVVVWPFFVFSCAYLAWRRKSWWHAVGVACGIHIFQNLLPGILIAAT